MGTVRRGQSRYLYSSGTDKDRREIRKERRSGGSEMECSERRGCDSEVRTQRPHGAEHGHLDFELSADDMTEIAKLDLGHSEIVNHDDPAFAKMLHSMKIHE